MLFRVPVKTIPVVLSTHVNNTPLCQLPPPPASHSPFLGSPPNEATSHTLLPESPWKGGRGCLTAASPPPAPTRGPVSTCTCLPASRDQPRRASPPDSSLALPSPSWVPGALIFSNLVERRPHRISSPGKLSCLDLIYVSYDFYTSILHTHSL